MLQRNSSRSLKILFVYFLVICCVQNNYYVALSDSYEIILYSINAFYNEFCPHCATNFISFFVFNIQYYNFFLYSMGNMGYNILVYALFYALNMIRIRYRKPRVVIFF